MYYVKIILESMRLRMHLQMILEVENKGVVGLVNTFCGGGEPSILKQDNII
jgi:hypothetical protein